MQRFFVVLMSLCCGLSTAALGQVPLPVENQVSKPSPQLDGRQRGRSYLGFGIQFAFYSMSTLLERETIQKELKLSDEQKSKLKKAESVVAKIQKEREEDRVGKRQELLNAGATPQEIALFDSSLVAEARNSGDTAALTVLNKNQRERLKQIQLQLEGPMAFLRDDLQKKLNIDEDRGREILRIVMQGRENLINASALPENSAREFQGVLTQDQRRALSQSKDFQAKVGKSKEAAIKSRASTMQSIGKLLTKNQRARYQNMLGNPFDALSPPSASQAGTIK